MFRLLSALVIVASILLITGCARVTAPTGGEPDREPPIVVGLEPEQFAVVPGWDRPVVIHFDERISEQEVEGSVLVSPETGAVRVKKGRRDLRVTIEGGWKPGQIYRVVVLPVIRDLFSNVIEDEIELIFSTGPEIPPTAVAGQLTDRLTTEPVVGARVEALNRADSAKYVVMSDSAGFFALRHIPAGSYSLTTYLDRNRNRRLDFGEPESSDEFELGPSDTLIVSYALLARDTTPARVVQVEERDTSHLVVTLDDHLDPEHPLDTVELEIRSLPDSAVVGSGEALYLWDYEARVMAAREEETEVDEEELVGAAPPEEERLPTREFVVIPSEPLDRESRYLLVVRGITNINGIGGGGGSAPFDTSAPPAESEPDPEANPDPEPGSPAGPVP